MKLDQATTIIDENKFVKSHTDMVNGLCPENIKKPYRDRLEKYYELKNSQ
jgi:hypothetical protein